jgi:transketolase
MVMTMDMSRAANAIRALAMDAVEAAGSGHPGMPMGMADVATVLFARHLKFDPAAPRWPDRDRFVLSAGHGSMLIYALLHLTGYEKPTLADIRNFRQMHSPCAGHPENTELPGVECTTGPLGQGLAMAVGMAIAERHLNAVFGDALVDHRTWVVAGDGCLMEGISQEAISLAGHLKLGQLNVIWDDNQISIDGPVSLSSSEDMPARFRAAGWHVVACDGHDVASIDAALAAAKADPRPSLIAAKTIIGKGAPTKAGTSGSHGSPLGGKEIEGARAALGWEYGPFEIPADIKAWWEGLGAAGAKARSSWEARLAASPERDRFAAQLAGIDAAAGPALQAYVRDLAANPKVVATRKASEMALGVLTEALPQLVGGSADLTGSNNTRTKATAILNADHYAGRYIHYGIREFGMAAAMNGMALHGGVLPYGGTFLVFSDYMRNAMRLSALQRVGVVYVLTHDSIGLGEDGPTHQPIEHVMSLRLIPNMQVFRPADVIETAECWALALASPATPSVLALTRQNLPQLQRDGDAEWTPAANRSARGAYRLKAAASPRRAVIVATGSEVEIALATAAALDAEGIGADVVSMPCWELFDAQDAAYKADLLPANVLKISIEAGVTTGWQKYVGDGLTIGLDHFGASAPAEHLFAEFGLTAPAIAARIRQRLG